MDTSSIKTGDLVLTGVVIEGIALNSISPAPCRTDGFLMTGKVNVILCDDSGYISKDNQNE